MKYALPTIIILYLVLATTYSVVTPLGEGPDEPGHATYVFFLAREGRLPVQCTYPCRSEVPGEGHQPPLAYLLATPALLWMPQAERSFDLPTNRAFVWLGGQQTNAVAHGSREYWPWSGEILAWHLARLVNIALGAVTILLTYIAGRRVLSQRSGLAGALILALNPQFLFISGLVSNDTLLTTLCAGMLVLVVGHERTLRRAIAIGVLLGLALLTKQSALLLVPIVAIWCLRDQSGGLAPVRRVLLRGLLTSGIAVLIAGWWYLRNQQLYGDPLGVAIFQAEFATQAFEPSKPAAWLGAFTTLHDSFWGRFGWMNVPAPGWAIGGYTLLELVAGAGLLRCIQARRSQRLAARRVGWSLPDWWPLMLIPLLALAWLVSFALTAGLVAWQGRLLFPALPTMALVLGHGLAALLGKQTRPHQIVVGAAAAAYAGLALWLPFGVIRPAYPFQTLPAAEAVRRIAIPVWGRFAARPDERGALLHSVRVDGEATPGAQLRITLIWQALGRQNRSWQVFVHLVDDKGEILAEDNREPRDGMFRMSQWVEGDWVEDPHPLTLPANLAPGTYQLRVGLWYPQTGRLAGRYDSRNKLRGDYLKVTTITVTR